jgi:hypothetical protein
MNRASCFVIIGNGAMGGARGVRYNRNHFELTLAHPPAIQSDNLIS